MQYVAVCLGVLAVTACSTAPNEGLDVSVTLDRTRLVRGETVAIHYYQTAGVTLELGVRFGPHWVFGTFDRREPEWCAAALTFAEATA